MDENEVVTAVCEQLVHNGYTVEQQLHTTERGIDIVARHVATGRYLYVEATSADLSRSAASRYQS
jgi:hypothetical protein